MTTPEHAVDEPAAERWSVLGAMLLSGIYLWAVVWLALAALVPTLLWGWQPLVITSGSMGPLVRPGDIVLAVGADHPVGAGTVITYEDPIRPGVLTTHRIVEVDPDGNYRTRGDANSALDSTPVPPDRVVGRGRLLVPMIGLPLLWASTAPWQFLLWAASTVLAGVVMTTFGLRDPDDATEPPPTLSTAGPGPWVAVPRGDRGARAPSIATGVVVACAVLGLVALDLPRGNAAFTSTTTVVDNEFAASSWFPRPAEAVARGSFTQQSSGTTAMTVPAGVAAGDLLVAFLGGSSPTVTPPSGWQLLRADALATPEVYTKLYWRIASPTDAGTTYTWASGTSVYSSGAVMLAYRGVDQSTPFDAHAGRPYNTSTSLIAPSVTTTVEEARLVAFHFHEAGGDSATTITPAPGMTEVFEGRSASRTIEIADEPLPSPGATGTRTATASAADDGIVVTVAIRPGPP